MKKCRRCGRELPLEEFYTHPKMADGHLNICKDCTKKRVSNYRENNLDEIRAYDRERGKLPHRKNNSRKTTQKRRHEVAGYEKAHSKVGRAVKSGEITRSNICQVCGKLCKTEGHHFNYEKTVKVVWLCTECHRQYHMGKTERARIVQNIVDNIVALLRKDTG